MAKHSKKIVLFNFIDMAIAQEFLELVGRKKMYANVTATMNPSGKLELTLIGSPENIKTTIQKLKKLHNSLIQLDDLEQEPEGKDEKDIDLKLKLKKLKFEES
ncbi:MAG: hypothetical protein EU530_10310 [Promethearchaeota archaeon]|nr:MAG: hypothetical protein EU530_10310 [Candidatus Lokiarchaeota archaeon]